jgi:hypothetical protein
MSLVKPPQKTDQDVSAPILVFHMFYMLGLQISKQTSTDVTAENFRNLYCSWEAIARILQISKSGHRLNILVPHMHADELLAYSFLFPRIPLSNLVCPSTPIDPCQHG